MRQFFPKRTSSSAASPKPAPSQQPAKPTPTTPEPRPDKTRQDRGHSRSARCYPLPKCQGPQPKIALDPAPQKSSWLARQKEEGPKSRYRRTTPQAVSNVPLVTPLSAVCRGECVIGSPRAHFSAWVSNCCDSGQNKTHTFSKREQISSSAYHKRPALMQPVFRAVSTSCHTGKRLACQAIPGVSEWVMAMIRRGYTLQFARRPPRFRGVLATTVRSEDAQVLHAEVMKLLEKGAIEIFPPAQSELGFYSRYFLIPKKDGGLQPILDLRLLNHALVKRSFRMITLKQILNQICPVLSLTQ